MGVNPEYVGRVYPPSDSYLVGREKIREFATAIGADHPCHHDVEAARHSGYADVVAPVTFGVIVAQRAEAQLINDPDAGIDFSRVVHADERFTSHRPIVAGDELVATVTVESINARTGLSMITTRTLLDAVVVDGEAEPVATVWSTLAVREAGA